MLEKILLFVGIFLSATVLFAPIGLPMVAGFFIYNSRKQKLKMQYDEKLLNQLR
tara:strand:- start:5870 stop:6031 length:162 start_codon:yes stop_codon:yes gene_type:complete